MKKKTSAGKADLVVGTKIRALIKSQKCMTSSEFLPALSKHVNDAVKKACERAKANKRTTLRARDL